MIFLDGVGIGKNDPNINPFFKKDFIFYKEIFGKVPHLEDQVMNNGNIYLFPSDANMEVEGLPQSGTGQTSIFCGVNAAEIIGKHFGPFPHSELKPIIAEKNIFADYKKLGQKVYFANAFPKIFFDYIKKGKQRLSVTSLSCLMSDVKLCDHEDLINKKALTDEIDNSRWIEKLNYKLNILDPEKAAERLLEISKEHSFTLFEYFLTDHLGHGRLKDIFNSPLHPFDIFLFSILRNVKEDVTVVICSDHGNLEDISVKTHTRNPALTITAGKFAESLSLKIKYLYDIKPALMEHYS